MLRVVLGPQQSHFTEAGLAAFLGSEFTVTAEADRMGYRLDGPVIEHTGGFNIISDGIPLGAIQVPGTGKPIILLADRQTTGGYPKIACVIAPMWRLWPNSGRARSCAFKRSRWKRGPPPTAPSPS